MALGIFVAGTVLGPLGLAVGEGIVASTRPADKWQAIGDLDLLLRAAEPIANNDMVFDADIEDCGYSRTDLFAADDDPSLSSGLRTPWRWTPYTGYFVLTLDRTSHAIGFGTAARAERLDSRLTPFGARFLERCIATTLFAPWCTGHAQTLLAGMTAPRDTTAEDRTICTYLDGLAARRGKPLARRQP